MVESALKTYKPDPSIFPQCLHKVLFMVPSEEFWRVDGWPDEASRNLYMKGGLKVHPQIFFSFRKKSMVALVTSFCLYSGLNCLKPTVSKNTGGPPVTQIFEPAQNRQC